MNKKLVGLKYILFCLLLAVSVPLAYGGHLQFVEVIKDGDEGNDGLAYANVAVLSPDDNFLYISASADNALSVFHRDAVTGTLQFVEMQQDGIGGVDGLDGAFSVSISPDGKHVYAAGWDDDAVAAFSRDVLTGTLTFVDVYKDGMNGVDGLDMAWSVTVSPDGNNVYVAGGADSAIAVFSRNSTTGALTFVEAQKDGVGGVDGLNSVRTMTVSPDGKHVYGAGRGESAITVFARDASTGSLTFVEMQQEGIGGVEGLDGINSVTVSSGGEHLYATGESDDAVVLFNRNSQTGSLTFVATQRDGVDGVDGLDGAHSVKVDAAGEYVYVAGFHDNAVSVFKRNITTGLLTYLETHKDGVGEVDGLDGVSFIAISSNGKHIYAPGPYDNAIVIFKRIIFPWILFMPALTAEN